MKENHVKEIERKFDLVFERLFDRHPFEVLDILKNICLIVFWGIKMGYDESEIIKLCIREVSSDDT